MLHSVPFFFYIYFKAYSKVGCPYRRVWMITYQGFNFKLSLLDHFLGMPIKTKIREDSARPGRGISDWCIESLWYSSGIFQSQKKAWQISEGKGQPVAGEKMPSLPSRLPSQTDWHSCCMTNVCASSSQAGRGNSRNAGERRQSRESDGGA